MELQLGLALPTATNHPIKGGFDLNNQSYEQQQQVADTWRSQKCNNKRGYDYDDDDALDNNTRPLKETLCLLLWKRDEDDGKNLSNNNLADSNNDSDEEEGNDVVGWPPIKTWRRKLRHPHQLQHENVLVHDHGNRRRQGQGQGQGQGGSTSNSMYVKVKMEGVGIGRKVNLGHHQSYQTLTATLIGMFGKYEETHHQGTGGLDGSRTPYVLTYQDREGDWLLVGDVPWQTFIRSVQSLKIQRRKNGTY